LKIIKNKEKAVCSTCECCFHPYAFELAEKNVEFKKMLCNTALDAIDK